MEAVVHGDGLIRIDGGAWRCCVGRGGIRPHKQEGDGATPVGLLPLRRVLFRADRRPSPTTTAPVEPIAPDDGWCDDPMDPRYNRAVRLPCDARHEELWRSDAVYDVVGILGWNDAPVQRGLGSAIFLHVARPDYTPTEGCIGMAADDLVALLAAGLTAIRTVAPPG